LTHFFWINLKIRRFSSLDKGAVLIQVLGVLLILLLIFLAVLTYALGRFGLHKRDQNILVATHLSEAGITRYLDHLDSGKKINDTIAVTAPNNGSYTVTAIPWGPYLLTLSDGFFANQTIRTTALIGSRPPELFKAAITVCDEAFPFVVAGNSKIWGDINVGPLEIQTGRIQGEAVIDKEFHKGEVHHFASLDVPELDTTILSAYLSEVKQRRLSASSILAGSRIIASKDSSLMNENVSILIEENLLITDFSYTNYGEIRSIFAGGRIEITGNSNLGGLIEIVASGPIILSDSVILDEVLLYTPDSIIITGNARFSGIAISKSKIVVSGNSQLAYLSMLLVDGRGESCRDECGIFLKSNGHMESICYMLVDSVEEDENDYLVYLDTLKLFTGFISSEGRTDVRGNVIGSVITERFHYFVPPTTYVNWVKDFNISRPALNYLPVPPVLRDSTGLRHVMIWRQDTPK